MKLPNVLLTLTWVLIQTSTWAGSNKEQSIRYLKNQWKTGSSVLFYNSLFETVQLAALQGGRSDIILGNGPRAAILELLNKDPGAAKPKQIPFDLTASNSERQTLLMMAIQYNQYEIFEAILKFFDTPELRQNTLVPLVNSLDQVGNSALHYVLMLQKEELKSSNYYPSDIKRTEMLNALIKAQANLNTPNRNGVTPIMLVSQLPDAEASTLIDLMLTKGANIKAKDFFYNSLLSKIIKKGNKLLVEKLLKTYQVHSTYQDLFYALTLEPFYEDKNKIIKMVLEDNEGKIMRIDGSEETALDALKALMLFVDDYAITDPWIIDTTQKKITLAESNSKEGALK